MKLEQDSLDPAPGRSPDRRKHGYKELEDKLDSHTREVETRLGRFFFRALIAFAVIGMTSAGALLGFGVVLSKQNDSAKEIQKQRYDNLVASCVEQNNRNIKTVNTLDEVLKQASRTASKAQQQQMAQSRTSTVLLINALAPFVADCDAAARKRVKDLK